MPVPDCVSENDLRAYVFGDLAEEGARAVTAHLAACPRCEAQARRLDDLADPVIAALRRPPTAAPAPATVSLAAPPGTNTSSAHTAGRPPLAVPGYEVLGELGRGGMSVVYKARQSWPERVVALKVLPGALAAEPARLVRFLAEADATARLRHANIVQIYAAGEAQGCPFLALEYLEGGSLAARLAGSPQPPRSAAALVETLARAVHYAHSQGVVHRDLKPGNVLLTADGTPKVADFGLAKQGGSDLTATGAILGTASYMAPEQAGGDSAAVGPAADVYALGVILYECLTGRPPFRAATPLETLALARAHEPVAPSQFQPKLARDLETICLKCLRKEPGRRYASAEALADDLRRFLAGEPIRARPVGAAERLWRWGWRHPGWAAAAGLLAVLAVGATTAAAVLNTQLRRVTRAEADKTEQLWEARFAGARATRLGRRPGQRLDSLELLDALARERPDPRLRDEMASCLALADLRIVRRWPIHPPRGRPVASCAFDDALELYAHLDRAGTLSVHRASDGSEVRRMSGEFEAPVFSPDGRFLAARRTPSQALVVWAIDGDGPLIDTAAGSERGRAGFTPDSRNIVSSGGGGTLTIYPLDGRPPTRLVATASRPADGCPAVVAVHPDGARAAVTVSKYVPGVRVRLPGTVQVRDLTTGAVKAELPVERVTDGLLWSPRGDVLAVWDDNEFANVLLWEPATEQTQVLSCPGRGIRAAFSRAGDLFVTADRNDNLRVWEPGPGRLLLTARARCLDLHFLEDGRLAAGPEDGVAVLWEIVLPRDYGTLKRPGARRDFNAIECCALSPDGRSLAVANYRGIHVWDVDAGRLRGTLTPDPCRGLVFEAPGELLTLGSRGMQRWRLEADPVAAGDNGKVPAVAEWVRPEPYPKYQYAIASSRSVTAVLGWETLHAFHRGAPQRTVVIGPHPRAVHVALSPDGRLAATASEFGIRVKVWDTDSGALVQDLPADDACRVGFSPDGRWLLTTAGGCRLWDVQTWEAGPVLGGTAFAFAADVPLLALETGQGVIRLLDPATGRDYVRLEDPERDVAFQLCLSDDGSRLIVLSRDRESIHVWDLRAIRARLEESGLAGDWPPPRSP